MARKRHRGTVEQEPSAADLKRARAVWKLFHAKEPTPAKDVHLSGKASEWPTRWGYCGRVKTIYYASDKWEDDGDYVNYYHDHGKGIGCWLPAGAESWLTSQRLPVKKFPQSVSVLGYCLGWDYQRAGGNRMYRAEPETGDELLCSFPNRKTLVVASPRQGVVALVSGPGLVVEARGIVG